MPTHVNHVNSVKVTVLWDVTPCRHVERYHRFGGTRSLHPQENHEVIPEYSDLHSHHHENIKVQLNQHLLLPC
jgi:hypothetical protein